MQLRLLFLPLVLLASPAPACSLTLGTAGTLALSSDGSRLESSVAGGSAATFTILNLSLGSATVQVAPPTLSAYPPGFNAGSAALAVSYSGAGVLGSISQPYTSGQSHFDVPGLLSLAVIMTVHNRITSTTGFAAGTYQTRTVVTCSS